MIYHATKGRIMRKISYEMIKSVEGMSSRQAARTLGVGKTAINDARAALRAGGLQRETKSERGPRILTWDIEWRPILAYTWGLWDQNIGIGQIVEHGGLMCFAAKWLGEDEVIFYSEYHNGYDVMLKAAHDLLSEADIVVSYNGDRYDTKRINGEFLKANMSPPRPYKSIDLIKTNRNRFDLPSRKLDYLVQQTGVGSKVVNGGFDLWINCMNNDPDAWALMKKYNEGDVLVTEGAYLRILPWITNSPHMGMFTGDGTCCPYCGKNDLVLDGVSYTNVQAYNLFKCANCGGWVRDTAKLQGSLTTRAAR
jgi:hypothetical protein